MDESVNHNNLSYMHEILTEQSKEFLKDKTDVENSRLYHTVEKYLKSQEMKLEIYDDSGVVCSLGNSVQIEPSIYNCSSNHNKSFSYKIYFQKY